MAKLQAELRAKHDTWLREELAKPDTAQVRHHACGPVFVSHVMRLPHSEPFCSGEWVNAHAPRGRRNMYWYSRTCRCSCSRRMSLTATSTSPGKHGMRCRPLSGCLCVRACVLSCVRVHECQRTYLGILCWRVIYLLCVWRFIGYQIMGLLSAHRVRAVFCGTSLPPAPALDSPLYPISLTGISPLGFRYTIRYMT